MRSEDSDETIEDESLLSNQEQNEQTKASKWFVYKLLFSHCITYAALFSSFVVGCTNIVFYVLIGMIINEFSLYESTLQQNKSDPSIQLYDPKPKTIIYIISLSVLAFIIALFKFFDSFLWMKIGSYISNRTRTEFRGGTEKIAISEENLMRSTSK